MDFRIKAKSFRVSKDLIFSYYVDNHNQTEISEKTRGVVSEITKRSYREFCFLLNNISYSPPVMITLTFPAYVPCTVNVKKLLLNRFLTYIKSRGVKNYIWIMEFQERGAVHFHIACDYPIVSRETMSYCWANACFRALFDYPKEFVWISDIGIFNDVLRFRKYFDSELEKHIEHGLDFAVKEKDFRHYLLTHALKLKQKKLPSYCSAGLGRWFGWSRSIPKFLDIPEKEYDIDFYFLRELLSMDFCYKYMYSKNALYSEILEFLTIQQEKDFLIMLTTVVIEEIRPKHSKITNNDYIELLVVVIDDSPLKDVKFTCFGTPADEVGQIIKLDVTLQSRRVKDWGDK